MWARVPIWVPTLHTERLQQSELSNVQPAQTVCTHSFPWRPGSWMWTTRGEYPLNTRAVGPPTRSAPQKVSASRARTLNLSTDAALWRTSWSHGWCFPVVLWKDNSVRLSHSNSVGKKSRYYNKTVNIYLLQIDSGLSSGLVVSIVIFWNGLNILLTYCTTVSFSASFAHEYSALRMPSLRTGVLAYLANWKPH